MTLLAKKKLGLIVNPIAGMGGKVGLKGTDSGRIVKRAMGMGATPVAPMRAVEALGRVARIRDEIELVTYPFEMGEEEAKECDLSPKVIGSIISGKTTATDTKNAAKEMRKLQVDLILFAGGDGTARDIYETIGQDVPALGIPAGVKMHSGIFAINPKRAGELCAKFLEGDASLREAEVMDIDEDAFRKGTLRARLFGYLRVPHERRLIQEVKSGTLDILDEKREQEAIAEYVVEKMDRDCYYILGSGTTVKAVADKFGIKKTLLGVDVIRNGTMVAMDLNEERLLRLLGRKAKAKIIVSPIGGQGFIFGRGNQQISPRVIKKIGRGNIIIMATKNKLLSIGIGQPLLVDTGDRTTDRLLQGYVRIIIGYNEEAMVNVAA